MEWLNALVNACTAFGTWDALTEQMLTEGYIPTLYPSTRRQRLLRKILLVNGWAVYPK